MENVVDGASWLLLIAGGAFSIIGGVGLLRLPDLFTRMHASGITDTLGAGLILSGLALQSGLSLNTVKLALIFGFLLLTSPVSTHALARAALHQGVDPLLAREEERSSTS